MDMIGSGKLSKDNLPQDRKDILEGIKAQIERFRKNAYEEEMECLRESKDRVKDKERPNNVISILGGRGSGKTSVTLTIHNELKEENFDLKKMKDEKNKKHLDLILDIIDPSKFNVEDNALGRIIYSFEDYVNISNQKDAENDKYCTKKENNSLNERYKELKNNYIYSRKFYRDKLSAITESRYEYDNTNQNIILADKNLEKLFREFIEEFCRVNREQCKIYNNQRDDGVLVNKDENNEPLIFITFDDVDISPEKGPEILQLILNYLSHPNIVCLVLGDYSTFSEALVIDLWNKSNIPLQLDKDTMANNSSTLFDGIVRRADDILGKVLPYNYRFELKDFSLRDRLSFTPFGKQNMPELYKLLDRIDISKVEKHVKDGEENIEKNTTLLKYFVEPLINISEIIKDINNLGFTDDDRTYNGYNSDVEGNREYERLVSSYEEQLVNNHDKLEKSDDKYKFIKFDKYDDPKEENYKLNIFDYAYVLSGNPRGLINLYYKLNDICENNPDLRIGTSKFLGYGRKQEIYIHNYNIYTKLFEAFYNSNIEIYSDDGIDVRKILRLNKDHLTLEINKKDICLLGGNYYEYANFNVSNNLLQLELLNNKTLDNKILNNEKSAFIQLFYDLAKIFLENKISEDNEYWNFKDVCIYQRKEDSISISSISFKYFYDFYYFQRLYKSCLPLIIRDRKVPIDIRNRFKAIALSIITCLAYDEREEASDSKNRFLKDIYVPSEFKYHKISEVKNKFKEINDIVKNYGLRDGISAILDSNNVIHEILYSQEQEYYSSDSSLNTILESSIYHLTCNKILVLSDNTKKGTFDRCREVKVIIDEMKADGGKVEGTLKEILRYAEKQDWSKIRGLLIKLNENIVDFIIQEVHRLDESYSERIELLQGVKDICQSFYNAINRNRQKEAPIGLKEFADLQEKLNNNIDYIYNVIEEQINSITDDDHDDDADAVINSGSATVLSQEEDTLVHVLNEFVSRKQIRDSFKEEMIGKLNHMATNDIIDKDSIDEINMNNFKEEMRSILEIVVRKWLEEDDLQKINTLFNNSTEENKELIRSIDKSYKEEQFEL